MKMHRSSLQNPLANLALWLLAIIGCTSGTPTSQQTNSTKDPHMEFRHFSKITVHHSPQQTKTFFTQRDIKFSPQITIKSQKVSGKHAFEIDVTAESSGVNSQPDKVTLTLLHDTPTKTGWHYPPKTTKFAAVADGQRFEFLCAPSSYEVGKESSTNKQNCIQSDPLTKDDPSDADYYEALFMDIPFQTFVAIGNAKAVQIETGEATFALPAETILAFHDFAEIMTNK